MATESLGMLRSVLIIWSQAGLVWASSDRQYGLSWSTCVLMVDANFAKGESSVTEELVMSTISKGPVYL